VAQEAQRQIGPKRTLKQSDAKKILFNNFAKCLNESQNTGRTSMKIPTTTTGNEDGQTKDKGERRD